MDWIGEVESDEIRQGSVVDLISQKIEMENGGSISAIEIDSLSKRGWMHMGIERKQKKDLRAVLSGYAKAAKLIKAPLSFQE